MFTMQAAQAALKQHWGHAEFRTDQKTVIEHIRTGKDVLAVLPTGYGKCFAPGTPILLHSGEVIPVQHVIVGDLLMGPDGKPRRVLSLSNGRGSMYRVTPKKGEPYVVNDAHVLSLKTTSQGGPYPSEQKGRIVNVSVGYWLAASKTFRHVHKGWRTGVEFPPVELHPNLPPYILGLWLGDGSCGKPSFTTGDPEVVSALSDYAKAHTGLTLRKGSAPYEWHLTDTVGVHGRGHHPNVFLNALRDTGVLDHKGIPLTYRTANRRDRLALLAGLMDSDGHCVRGMGYEIIQKREALADDIAFLARSLGFAAYISEVKKSSQNGTVGTYYLVTVYGLVDEIPVRLPHKKAKPRAAKKDVLVTGISVEPVGEGHYYGFAVGGDHLFMLGDFTVVHNSVCFQVPAVLSEGSALVISPLIALMKDQVDDCLERGIPATFVNSHVDEGEQEDRFDDFIAGHYKLLYVAPERIRSKMFIAMLKRADIRYLVVDEAHCASMWGHDFRPMYSRIKIILDIIGDEDRPQVIAVTATATTDIEDDIATSIGMALDYKRLIGDPIRANLRYKVEYGNEWANMNRWARRFNPLLGRYVVYVGTRNGAERVCEMIGNQIGSEYVGVYHAGLRKPDREQVQEAFKDGTLPVIVATCAFGMGIDVPNIRAVIHFGIPGSLEDYVQESGRAGRDGRYADVVLIDSEFSYTLRQMFIDNANPSYAVFQMLWDWLHDVLQEGGTLHKSGDAIAQAMSAAYEMDGRLTGDMVRGALNIMESHRLLTRAYARAGVTVITSREALDAVTGRVASKVASALSELAVGQLEGVGPLEVDRTTLASSVGISDLAVARTLKALEKKGVLKIKQQFRGKTTRVRKWQADLDEHLPKERIIKKRERELKRLGKMIEYITVDDRVQFIRDYFQKGF